MRKQCRSSSQGQSTFASLGFLTVLALSGCGGGSGENQRSGDTQSQSSATSVNKIVTSDSPSVRTEGSVQTTDAYLSRSAKIYKGQGPARAIFHGDLVQSGYYRVFLWWPQVAPGAQAVDVSVAHRNGNTTVSVDQSVNGGQWNTIGIFEFDASFPGELTIKANGGSFLADAVRFEYVGKELPPVAIETQELPLADKELPYRADLTAVGGTPPYVWELSAGTLPEGLVLDQRAGVISGSPALTGAYEFTATVRDARDGQARKTWALQVLDSVDQATDTNKLDMDSETRFTPAEARPTGTPPNLSNLLDVLQGASEGQWVKANLNLFSDVWAPTELRPLKGASTPTPSKIILAWSSFAWDPNRGDLYLYGGGHANYSGNDVYRWRATTRLWERASLPSEIKQDDRGNFLAVDGPNGAPPSAHTYDNNIFFPVIDRLIAFGGAAYNNGGPYQVAVNPPFPAVTSRKVGPYFFDPAKANPNRVGGTTGSHVKRVSAHPEVLGGNMWLNRDLYRNLPGASLPVSHVNGCTAYAQENGKDVAYVGARSGSTALALYRYTVSDVNNVLSDTWERVGRYAVGTSDQAACGYDPQMKALVRTGVNTRPLTYWNLNTASTTNNDIVATLSDPGNQLLPLLASNTLRIRQCGFDFDGNVNQLPNRKRYALWCGDGKVWMITPPATLAPTGWSVQLQRAPLGQTPNGDQGSGIIGKWKYIYNLDAYMGLQDANQGNIWLYKPVGWQRPGGSVNLPPLVTLTSPSGGVFTSGTPIGFSANASDPDGSILKVEFYNGTIKVGEDTSGPQPYTFSWLTAPVGTLTLKAVAFDNQNRQTTSNSVIINVQAGANTTVVLQQGLNGYTATQDVYLSSFHKSTNTGASTQVQDQYTSYTSLVKFAIFQAEGGPIPNNATIRAAKLSLQKFSSYDMTYALHPMLVDWSESTSNWNQRSSGQLWGTGGAASLNVDYASVPDSQATIGRNPGWLEFDLTAGVQAIRNGRLNHGWRLTPVAGTLSGLKRFYTREFADPALRPKLEVTYSTN
jgi:hypothetical protein